MKQLRVSPQSIVALLFALLSFRAMAAPADEFDRYVQTQLQRQHIPGLSLAIGRRIGDMEPMPRFNPDDEFAKNER